MSSLENKKRQFLTASAGCALALLISSFQPGSMTSKWLPSELLHSIAHVVAYTVMGYFLAFYLRFERKFAKVRMTDWKLVLFTMTLCLAWGGLNEWVQLYQPGRVADWKDFALDALGAAIGLSAFFFKDKITRCR